ncbi:MAG: type IX secretion system protein PorQ [Muribaculaceae bacterium]|nr:type IX secretion system protein PorQ [Muribaculaceae bacterium]
MKWLRIIVAAIVASGFATVTCLAQVGGSTAYNFLDVSTSSRIYGLGGVNISLVDDDLMLTDQNPALLGPEMSNSLAVSYMRYIGDSNFAAARYGRGIGERAAWALGLQYFGYGSIKSADVAGNVTGSFSPKDMALTGTFCHNLGERWRGGFNLKLLYSAYDAYSALAIATDLGVNYFDEDRGASVSLTVSNLGGQVKRFHERYDRLPVDVRLGYTQRLGSTSPVSLSITAHRLTRWNLPYVDAGDGTDEPKVKNGFMSNLFRHLVFGLDWRPNDNFYLDVAYNYKTRTDMSNFRRSFLSGFSIGAGVKVKMMQVGVALAQPHSGATTFMVNLSTNLYEF